MARRFLTALILAALAAGAWWLAHGTEGAESGLVVQVEVLDEHGAPVTGAQIERVFENKRQRVGAGGIAELTHVVLRELDARSPEALTRAIRIHAPFHALRPGAAPEASQGPDGAWTMRWKLAHHGVLRLYVEQTHLGPCKAAPETAGAQPTTAWDAVGGAQVARHGSPASLRIFDASEPLVVRLEGEADRDGAIGVATRKVVVALPPPGHVQEQVLTPEPVAPILAQVRAGEGPPPPSLGGLVRITQLAEDGARTPLALVKVPHDGRFLARRTGAGRYELVFDLDFFPGTTTLTVLGGANFDLTPSSPATWCRLDHPGLDLSGREAHVRLYASGQERHEAGRLLGGKDVSYLPLPAAGSYGLQIHLAGTQAQAPLEMRRGFDLVRGEAVVPCTFDTSPHGTLAVQIPERAFGKARGATVRLLLEHAFQRSATMIPGLTQRVTFRHLPAGPSEVLVEWDQTGRKPWRGPVEVRAGETTTLVLEDAGP